MTTKVVKVNYQMIGQLVKRPDVVHTAVASHEVLSVLEDGLASNPVRATQGAIVVSENQKSSKTVSIPIEIRRLRLLDLDSKDLRDKELAEDEQPWILILKRAETGIFPKGYDGVFQHSPIHKYRMEKVLLKPSLASSSIIRSAFKIIADDEEENV